MEHRVQPRVGLPLLLRRRRAALWLQPALGRLGHPRATSASPAPDAALIAEPTALAAIGTAALALAIAAAMSGRAWKLRTAEHAFCRRRHGVLRHGRGGNQVRLVLWILPLATAAVAAVAVAAAALALAPAEPARETGLIAIFWLLTALVFSV